MALMPKRVKYRKMQRGKNRGIATRGNSLLYGEFGLKSIENGFIKSNHIESARVVVARKSRGAGRLWINIFPRKPVTKKPPETRQGKGKGDLHHWGCPIQRGKVLFEMSGVPEAFAKQIFRLVAFKLPVQTKFISRETR